MNPKFSVGNVVKLKSGGPDMTITIVMNKTDPTSATQRSFKGSYICEWFLGNTDNKKEFPEDALEFIR